MKLFLKAQITRISNFKDELEEVWDFFSHAEGVKILQDSFWGSNSFSVLSLENRSCQLMVKPNQIFLQWLRVGKDYPDSLIFHELQQDIQRLTNLISQGGHLDLLPELLNTFLGLMSLMK